MAPVRRAAYVNPGRDLGAAVALARRAEAAGYESVWVTHGLGRDSFLVLAAYAAATTSLRLGNGVVPIYPRHPIAMAQAALTLSELSGGRFTLGVGVSHRETMEAMFGLPLTEPLAVMREYVAAQRERHSSWMVMESDPGPSQPSKKRSCASRRVVSSCCRQALGPPARRP